MDGPLLALRDVTVRFGPTRALAGVSLEVRGQERIALVGNSGSGKTTLLGVACGLRRPHHGTVTRAPGIRLGLLLQDPVASLNPSWTLGRIIAEPLQSSGGRSGREQRAAAVRRALVEVGLGTIDPDRYPAELSVGQCQRVALARALIAAPSLLLADEPTSALDPSVAAGVLRLLDSTLTSARAALLVVSHDVLAVAPLVERLVVLHEGHIVEDGTPASLLDRPRHAATVRLVETAHRLAIRPPT